VSEVTEHLLYNRLSGKSATRTILFFLIVESIGQRDFANRYTTLNGLTEVEPNSSSNWLNLAVIRVFASSVSNFLSYSE
jgi:hypothetical protein